MQPPGPKSRAAKKSKTSHHRDFPTHGSTMRPAAISSTHRPTHGRRVSTSNNQSQQAAAADRVSNKPSNRHVGRHTTQSCGPASASTDQTRDITTDTHGVPTETGCCLDSRLTGMREFWPYDSVEEFQQYEKPLHSMFGFKHLKAAEDQSDVTVYCNLLVDYLSALEHQVTEISPNTPGCGFWPSLSLEDFQAFKGVVHVLTTKHVTWYPKFGCALLAVPSPHGGTPGVGISVGLDQLSLHLVALDSWAFHIHSCPGHVSHTAAPDSHAILFSGSIPSAAYKKFQAQVAALVKKRQNSDKKVGFQHTPAFMHAVVQDAAASVAADTDDGSRMTYPKGGFTDVGQHTGSAPRNTSWPLVKQTLLAVFKTFRASNESLNQLLFRRAMVHLDLWLLLGSVNLVTADTASNTTINKCMVMLQAFTAGAAALAADKHDIGVLPELAEGVLKRLQATVVQRQQAIAARMMLPASETTGALLGHWRLPIGTIPAEAAISNSAKGLPAARLRAAANLGSLPAVQADQHLGDVAYQLILLLQEAAEQKDHGGVRMQHALRSVEVELFGRAVHGISSKPEYAALSEHAVDQLWNMVDWYRDCLKKHRASTAGAAHLQMDLRSRELLVVWVAYCITFEAGRRQHPLLQQYGVALQFQDLRHLSLSDRAATDAALAVGSYLSQHTVAGRPLFSLRDSGVATFDLAVQYAGLDSGMRSTWYQEELAAQIRVRKHWEKVRQQQQEARELCSELKRLRNRVSQYWDSYHGCSYNSSSYYSDRSYYMSRINSVESTISSTQSALSAAERPPKPVIQPLPEGQTAAMQWLFFLYMPPLLRQLSRGSFLAQQLLLPLPLNSYPEAQQSIQVDSCNTSLAQHYNSANADSSWYAVPYPGRTGSEGKVMLYSAEGVPKQSDICLGHIDSYTSDRVGVWYPDDLTPMMAWQGTGAASDSAVGLSDTGFFNPFRSVAESTVLDSFTEKLPQQHHSMQWAMQQPYSREAVATDRGNVAIAQQDQGSKPSWLSKHAYLKLAGLRSYPLRQLHRLATLLHECRDMPFDHHVVQAMVRQTLCHLGPLVRGTSNGSGTIELTQEWRTQWDAAGGVLDALHSELQKLADELADKPRAHEAVLLLGGIAAYLSDWHAPCKAVARQFADMTSAQADEQLQGEVDKAAKAADEKAHTEMFAKQCRSRMMALLCYAAGPLEAVDVQHMIKLMVQIKHGDVYLGQVSGLQAQMAKLRALCHDVMCRRLRDIHGRVLQSHLTAAASSVLQTVPGNLAWRVLRGSDQAVTASYEAVGADDQGCKHLYSINILDGTVLLDGFPPGRLPREVIEHPMYLRTFGRVDFEVFRTEQGVLVTTRAVNGRHYEFTLSATDDAGSSADELMIVEVDDQAEGERLQLLDAGEGHQCAGWGEQLPVRLRELHSHWLSRRHGVILLRPQAFLQHSIHHIIRPRAISSSTRSLYGCWRIPSHLQNRHWLQLLPSNMPDLYQGQMVLPLSTPHVLEVLSVFEDKQFIHVYKGAQQQQATTGSTCSTSVMLFELPRFGLEFELHSNGVLAPRDFKGYRLHKCQQLVSQAADGSAHYTLPDFVQYLVLQHSPELSSDVVPGSGRSDVLVLVPAGQVQPVWSQARKVTVVTNTSSNAKLKFHTYELHGRFQYLQASSIESRLQLAALYAATSSLLPEPSSLQTGAETAMQLVRQSWSNKPLEPAEVRHLLATGRIGGHLAPALRLLTFELAASSRQLQHLHVHNAAVDVAAPMPVLACDSAAEYQQLASLVLPGGWVVNHKQLLTPLEEQRILQTSSLGTDASDDGTWRWLREHGTTLLKVPPCPVKADFISTVEAQLISLVAEPLPCATDAPPYPLKCDEDDSIPLRQEMHKELQESWESYHSSPEATEITPGAKEVLFQLQPQVQDWRQQAEAYVLQHLCDMPTTTIGQAGSCFKLLQSSHTFPTAGSRDLLSCAIDRKLIARFNPFLSETSATAVHEGILIWAQLCVLEDRLERLMNLFAAGVDTYKAVIIRELLVERIWDPFQHPKWLVFEVEGRLQIRPDQYHHAKELLAHTKESDGPGPITQLNMGEGKTRVILPMLALEWADRSCVVRLNFLSPLLSMSYQHLHNTLTASVLNVRLFTMPFHRDVQVAEQGAQAMLGALAYCQQVGGLLLVAPEHRLSLLLKSYELWGAGDNTVFGQLQQIMALPYQDILDESDELLHHRLQLVYACGMPQPLAALQERTIVIQAVLRLVSDMVDAETCPEFTTEGVAVWTPSANRPPGAFCGLQLLAGSVLESVVPGLHKRLVEELVKAHPHEMRWLVSLKKAKGELLSCATDPAVAPEHTLSRTGSSLSKTIHNQQDLKDQVLVMRGLLACNLLQHTLQKRHRVHYGVSRLSSARKRLAVPFRAADTPSPRSEFAQPDVALILTHLSYYYDGLTLEEFKDALVQLLLTGPSAQEDYYKQWWQLSQARVLPEHKPVFDDVRKIDPTNSQQLQLMHSYMSHNMAAINFWLSYCVLSKETVQYPKRLVATSWNLADNPDGRVVGFSGTNDNHRLLPIQVQQRSLTDHPHLVGTNGKMLAMLLRLAGYNTLDRPAATNQAEYKPDWQLLLDAALQQEGSAGRIGVEALLDCGALLAGVETRDAALYILQHMPAGRYQGVCYYEPSQQQWTVADTVGRITALSQSPITEADCLVIYDDARCRGADLKLNQQAVALLTLAPGMCKDKMMQAAGRMRQLGRGQTLLVVGLPDVTDKICESAAAAGYGGVESSEPSMLDVLQWVMNNTVQSTLQGVVEHATQGMQFAVTKGTPAKALLDEKLLLSDFYGSSKAKEPVAAVLQAAATKSELLTLKKERSSSSNCEACPERLRMSFLERQDMIQRVLHKGTTHGQGYSVVAGQGADEECERELEEEEEEEKEEEKEIPRVTAAAETDWDYSAAFASHSVAELVRLASGRSLQGIPLPNVAPALGAGFKEFAWSAKVYCTGNFVRAIQHLPVSGDAGWGLYQQYLDAVLVLGSGDVLLLSQREAEGLQELVWGKSATSKTCSQPPMLLSLSYGQQVMQSCDATPLLLADPLCSSRSVLLGLAGSSQSSPTQYADMLQQRLMQSEMVTMRFFNGETGQYSAQQQQTLHELVKGKREPAKDLLSVRDQLAKFARSDLEKACDY